MNIFLFQTLLRHWSDLYLVHHQRVFFCPVVQQQFTERQIVNDGRNMEAGSASVVWSIHCIRGVLPLKQVLYHILKNNEIYVTIAGIFNCIEKENPHWILHFNHKTHIFVTGSASNSLLHKMFRVVAIFCFGNQ